MPKKLKNLRRRITYSDCFINMLAGLAVLSFRLYVSTLKVKFIQKEDTEQSAPAFYGFWHGRQFLLVPFFARLGIAIMSDLSWAGEIQARILSRFGYEVVRGSSKRESVRALLGMKKKVDDGYNAAFALDGPSGPLHKSKPGIVYLAAKTGRPIVPVATSAQSAFILKNTWCGYMVPKPFSRCIIASGSPITVTESFSERHLDEIIEKFQETVDKQIGFSQL